MALHISKLQSINMQNITVWLERISFYWTIKIYLINCIYKMSKRVGEILFYVSSELTNIVVLY